MTLTPGKMVVLGLTGSIGMGKTTVGQMFRELGVPVYDADASVHELYSGEAAPVVEELFPGTVSGGQVDRERLAARVLNDPAALARLEAAIHPLVRRREEAFVSAARMRGEKLVVLDIPLLFETGSADRLDGVIVVTADPEEQRRRVLARPGMTVGKFGAILARQTPDSEKRRRADFLVDTGLDRKNDGDSQEEKNFEKTRAQVREVAESVLSGKWQPSGRAKGSRG